MFLDEETKLPGGAVIRREVTKVQKRWFVTGSRSPIVIITILILVAVILACCATVVMLTKVKKVPYFP